MSEMIAKVAEGVKEVIKVNEEALKSHLNELVRNSVEETLNKLLEEEADRLCRAKRYERNAERMDTRAGTYSRGLMTQAGEVKLKIPKLRELTFGTEIIERYRRKESSVEEALVEMYLSGVSVRRVEDITEVLWGTRVSPSTVSELNKKLGSKIEEWRNRKIEGSHIYIWLDGIWLKRSWAGEVRNVAVLVAIGVNDEGYREVLGIKEGSKEDKESWLSFLRHLKERGLKGTELITSDKCLGLIEALGEVYPQARWQRCVVHWYRNIFSVTPDKKVKEVAAMVKAIHAQEDREAALKKASDVKAKLLVMGLKEAAKVMEEGVEETLTYMSFAQEHWTKIRTNNPLERIMREIRRRTRVVGCFPDQESAMLLVSARLRHIAGTRWGMKQYMNVTRYREEMKKAA